jgi:hypothetical protein
MKAYSNIVFYLMKLFLVASLTRESLIIPTEAVVYDLPQDDFQCTGNRTIEYNGQYSVLSNENIDHITYNFEFDYGEHFETFSGSIHEALHETVKSSYTFDKDGIYDISNTKSLAIVLANGETWRSIVVTTIRRFQITGDSCEQLDITDEDKSLSHQEPLATGSTSATYNKNSSPISNKSFRTRKAKEAPVSSSSKAVIHNWSPLFMTMVFFWLD